MSVEPKSVEPESLESKSVEPATSAWSDAPQPRQARLHLVFNGEVYNHRDLRAKLEKRGHVFQSDHSDTEVLLYGYRQWGDRLPKHIHGMFAFAIYDEADGSLFLCRDRAGKKPLFLRMGEGSIEFASLMSSLIAAQALDGDAAADRTDELDATDQLYGAGGNSGAEVEVDQDALITFMRFGYCFQRGLLGDVLEVAAGHWLRIDARGGLSGGQYWQPPPLSRHSTALGAVDAVREVLTESVASRLEADVPLGCFLSGGIDSSLVAAIAQKQLALRGADRLRTYSMRMDDAEYDETPYALAVAGHIGSAHTVLDVKPDALFDDLDTLMAASGEPTADSSLLPTYWLCKATREHVRVALSGDGGDELFGGYDRYRAVRLLSKWRTLVAALPVAILPTTKPKSRAARLARLIRAARAGRQASRQYQRMIELFDPVAIRELGLYAALEQQVGDDPHPPCPNWPTNPMPIDNAMRWDLDHYLPYELLRKVDRAAMAVALEVRCPLLDTQVLDLAGHLPAKVLMPGHRPKGLLRQLAVGLLPPDIIRRPKQGFAVPIGRWLAGPLAQPLRDRLLDHAPLATLGIAEPAVARLLDEHTHRRADHAHRLFALLQLAIWVHWLRGMGIEPRTANW